MARRSEHSQEEIKEMVLKAAEDIIAEEGFSALKVRKIAMDIGYTVGSIYMVFDNMADLIMHVKGRTLDDISTQLKQVPLTDHAEQNIEQLAKSYLTYAQQNFNRWRMIFDHQLSENQVVPDWYQEKANHIFTLVELQFKALSGTHNNAQNSIASRALWSGVHGICILSLTGKLDLLNVDDIESTITLLVNHFIKGWQTT